MVDTAVAAPTTAARVTVPALTAGIRVTATIGVGQHPVAVAVDPLTRTSYVVNELSDSVSVINERTNTVVATVGVGHTPSSIAVDLLTDTIYVPGGDGEDNENTVSVINERTNTVVATVTVGDEPVAIALRRRQSRPARAPTPSTFPMRAATRCQ